MYSTSAVAIRPLIGSTLSQCLRRISVAKTQMHSPVRPANVSKVEADILLCRSALQRRHKSSSSNRPAEQKPPMPSSKLLLRALRQSLSFRPLFSAFRGQNLRAIYRQSPEELVIALVLLTGVAGACVYCVYAYYHYFQSEQFTRFPPEIAKSLRRALYYSNYAPDPKLALKYYKIALQQCTEAGLDPFSDEVIGLRIQVAAWLEQIGSFKSSIDVLEALLGDCKGWVRKMEESVADGLVDSAGRLKAAAIPEPNPTRVRNEPDSKTESEEPVNLWARRTRILGRSVGISVKLGQLYADEHVLQGDPARERLVWAVETVLKELSRRQTEGIKEGEGDWMSPEEIGGSLEALANSYESRSQHYLAAPLYLQAITLSPTRSCHAAVLMNNLAISLAQQPVVSPFDAQGDSSTATADQSTGQAPTRATLLNSARSWALQALGTAQKVTGEERTDECDSACAVALCNLGDIAVMSGDMEEAKRRFNESLALSRRIAFEPGNMQAQEGLRRVSNPSLTTAP